MEEELELSQEEAEKLYGPAPEEVPDAPQTHGVEEAYEVGDTNIQ